MNALKSQLVEISSEVARLKGDLTVPQNAAGLVIFAHGSGNSRFSPRNRQVAEYLNRRQLATLLLDLLTTEEGGIDRQTAFYRFDTPLLGRRLGAAVDWASNDWRVSPLPIGCFGASTGAAAALIAAATHPADVRAVVSRGGRPDLAGGKVLAQVKAPTLLIVGGADREVLELNHRAMIEMTAMVELRTIPAATHMFEEPGAMEQVRQLAADWFVRHL